MKKTTIYKWLAALLVAALLAGCSTAAPSPEKSDTEKQYIETVTYLLPRGWETESDQLGGYQHFPKDGGALYVSKVLYQAADFTQPEAAYRVAYLERDRMMNSLEEPKLLEEAGDSWKGTYSVSSWFTGQVEGKRTSFYARIFPYDNYLYAFLFAFPNTEESQLHSQFTEIEDSIWIPCMAGDTSE